MRERSLVWSVFTWQWRTPSTGESGNFIQCICEVELRNCWEVYILVGETKSKDTAALLCDQWVIKLKDEVFLPQPWGIGNPPGRGTTRWKMKEHKLRFGHRLWRSFQGWEGHCHVRMKVESESESEVVSDSDSMDCSLPGSSVHGIFQERVLEWVVIALSRWSSQPGDWTWVSRIVGRHFTVWATREVIEIYIFNATPTWARGMDK